MIGSSGRQRVQIDVIENLQIEVPPLEGQRKIGSLLKSLDDKIALNNRINDNLQQQAQAIFEKEFLTVQTLPEGWKQASLIDIADYQNGLAMQNIDQKMEKLVFRFSRLKSFVKAVAMIVVKCVLLTLKATISFTMVMLSSLGQEVYLLIYGVVVFADSTNICSK